MSSDWATFFDETTKSSESLNVKMRKLLDKFKDIVEKNDNVPGHFCVITDTFNFLITNNADEESLRGGLDQYFSFISDNLEKLFNSVEIEKFQLLLENNQEYSLFQRCTYYWFLLKRLKKRKDPTDVESFRLRFNQIYNMKRPLPTEALELSQKAHDAFEKNACCNEYEANTFIYLCELLSVGNKSMAQKVLYSDPKFVSIIRNTKMEIVRLLKCLFNVDFKLQPCDHPTINKDIRVYSLFTKEILEFYLPKEVNLIGNEHKIDMEIAEVCEKFESKIKSSIARETSKEFNIFLKTTSESMFNFVPDCHITTNGEMEDLNPNFNGLDVLNFPCATDISTDRRLVLAKAGYYLVHKRFYHDDKLNLNSLYNVLMLGKDVLDKKSIAFVWYLIARCMMKNTNFYTAGSEQLAKMFFSSYMSLLFNKTEAETHIWLVISLYYLHRFGNLNATSSTNSKFLAIQKRDNFFECLILHVNFAATYVLRKNNVENVAKILNNFLEFVKQDFVDGTKINAEHFITITVKHLSVLIRKEIQRPVSTSVKSIHNTHKVLLDLFESLKDYSSTCKNEELKQMIKELESTWMSGKVKPQEVVVSNNQLIDQTINESQDELEIQILNDESLLSNVENQIESLQPSTSSQSNASEELVSEEDECETQLKTKEEQFNQCIKNAVELKNSMYALKLKVAEKKHKESNSQYESQISDLQSQLDKLNEEKVQWIKEKELLVNKNAKLTREVKDKDSLNSELTQKVESLQQTLKEKAEEEKQNEESYARMKRHFEEEDRRRNEAKRKRYNNSYDH